jgi:hypothetical protein
VASFSSPVLLIANPHNFSVHWSDNQKEIQREDIITFDELYERAKHIVKNPLTPSEIV